MCLEKFLYLYKYKSCFWLCYSPNSNCNTVIVMLRKIFKKKLVNHSKTAKLYVYFCHVNEGEILPPLKGSFFSP